MTATAPDTGPHTQNVLDALGRHGEITPRQREIATALIRHLHDFCRETDLQMDEFLQACDFLARAGKISDEKRQEFILLGDIVGVESLVDSQTNRTAEGETASAVLGPFYRPSSPKYEEGSSILQQPRDDCETVLCRGQVRDGAGNPIGGALIEIWQDAPNGLYEQQDEDQPDYNLRGTYLTDEDGHYAIRCIRPVPYPIPTDGTAGQLIRFMGHHPMRPAHLHFKLSRTGYRTLVTQLYDADSDHLAEDSVFAVKDSLVVRIMPAGANADTDLELEHDFVLASN